MLQKSPLNLAEESMISSKTSFSLAEYFIQSSRIIHLVWQSSSFSLAEEFIQSSRAPLHITEE